MRMLMLRRKTDPKTGKHTSCEPAQPKCRRTLHKSHFVWKFRGKMAAGHLQGHRFVRACASRNAHGQSTKPFCMRKFTGKMPNILCKNPGNTNPRETFCASLRRRNAHGHVTRGILCGNLQGKCRTRIPRTPVLCEPAQSKCTWTCHKRHFVRKFTGKMPDASDTTSIEHRPLTVTVRTFQCGHTVWRNTHTYTYA